MDQKYGLTQEGLKILACVTMLIDHVGVVFFPGIMGWRIVGRLAFPIYCFLMAEGMARTRNVKKYGIRLAIGALLAEIPFDLLFYHQLTLAHQSVMVTLLIGYGMVVLMKQYPRFQLATLFLCAMAAGFLHTDYGALGVLMIGMFVLTRELKYKLVLQTVLLGILLWYLNGYWVQMCALAAMVPIALYNGRKSGHNKTVQWIFYLFYPVHMAVLLLLS